MTETKHTEGPWIACYQESWRVEWDGSWRNDGYIIAAAPDLIHAVMPIIDCLRDEDVASQADQEEAGFYIALTFGEIRALLAAYNRAIGKEDDHG